MSKMCVSNYTRCFIGYFSLFYFHKYTNNLGIYKILKLSDNTITSTSQLNQRIELSLIVGIDKRCYIIGG